MPNSKQRTAEELLLIRHDNIDKWNDEDRAFYEDFFDELPLDNNEIKSLNVSTELVDESWNSFNELNHKLLSARK